MIVGFNGLVAFTGALTLPVGAAVLALAALPVVPRPAEHRLADRPRGRPLAAIATLGAVGMLRPDLVPSVPETGSPLALTLLAVGLAPLRLPRAARASNSFLLTRRRGDVLVVDRPRVPRHRARRRPHVQLHAARLVARPRLRARRHPPRRDPGRARPAPRAAVAAAHRRPAGRRARRGRADLPRRPRPRAHAPPGREGQVHGGAHAPRRAPRRPGRRGARARAEPAPQPGDRRAAPRHRQARRARRDPEEARLARRGRVRGHQAASRVGPSDSSAAGRLLRGRATARARPPRAAGRQRLPQRPLRGGARPRDADPRRVRRVRRAPLHARLPGRLDARPGDGPPARADRVGVRRGAASARSSACSHATRRSRSASRSSLPFVPTELERALAFEEAVAARCAERIVTTRSGKAYFNDTFRRVWHLNYLRVDPGQARRPGRAGGRGRAPAHRCRPRTSLASSSRTRRSAHRWRASSAGSAGASTASSSWPTGERASGLPTRPRWRRSRGRASSRCGRSSRGPSRGRRTRRSCARSSPRARCWPPPATPASSRCSADGRPVSTGQLHSDVRVAEVDDVATLEPYRGRGYASAVVLRAVEEALAAGNELVFLVADDEDWPKQLYGRLGFEPIGCTWHLLRTPVQVARD